MKTNAKPIIISTLILFIFCFVNIQESSAQSQEVHQKVDVMPIPQGDMQGLMQFMGENLKYPSQAKEKGVEGTVIVSFVVQADGSVSSPEILRGIGAGCDEEALRVVKAFPNWTPGEKDGKKVNTQMQLPVKYKL